MPFTRDDDSVAVRGAAKKPTRRAVVQLAEARTRRREPAIRAEVLAGLMRTGYGDDPRIDDLAARLADLSSEEALDLSLAADLDELAAMLPDRTAQAADGAMPA